MRSLTIWSTIFFSLAEDDRQVPGDAEPIAEFDLVGSVEGLSDDEVDQLLAARISRGTTDEQLLERLGTTYAEAADAARV